MEVPSCNVDEYGTFFKLYICYIKQCFSYHPIPQKNSFWLRDLLLLSNFLRLQLPAMVGREVCMAPNRQLKRTATTFTVRQWNKTILRWVYGYSGVDGNDQTVVHAGAGAGIQQHWPQ